MAKKVGEKIPRVFQSHKLTFPSVIATESKRNNDLHQGSFHINSSNTTGHHHTADIYWAGSLLPEILMILFTQSTAVLHKYLNDELKILCLLQFSGGCTEFPENSPSFPCLEKSLSIAGFPPCQHNCTFTANGSIVFLNYV